MRLAGCISQLDGGDIEYITATYAALVTQDYDAMTPIAKALSRQVAIKNLQASNKYDALARGLKVFDIRRAALTKLMIDDAFSSAATELVRKVVTRLMGG